jgi:selenocysteine lyase/cysteine desulfurase
VRPAGDEAPDKFENGTKNHEGLAGVAAAIAYIAQLGVTYGRVAADASRREKLRAAWTEIVTYEQMLIDRLISGLQLINRVRIYGITSRFDWTKRVATVSIRKEGATPEQLAQALAQENIFAWNGNFYALALSDRLGVEPSGGLLRLGLVHYNTLQEIDRCLRVLEQV